MVPSSEAVAWIAWSCAAKSVIVCPAVPILVFASVSASVVCCPYPVRMLLTWSPTCENCVPAFWRAGIRLSVILLLVWLVMPAAWVIYPAALLIPSAALFIPAAALFIPAAAVSIPFFADVRPAASLLMDSCVVPSFRAETLSFRDFSPFSSCCVPDISDCESSVPLVTPVFSWEIPLETVVSPSSSFASSLAPAASLPAPAT